MIVAFENIDGLAPHRAENLKNMLKSNQYDVIVLTETWPNRTDINDLIQYNTYNYDFYHKTLAGIRQNLAQGVLIAVKSCLNSRRIQAENNNLNMVCSAFDFEGSERYVLAAYEHEPNNTMVCYINSIVLIICLLKVHLVHPGCTTGIKMY